MIVSTAFSGVGVDEARIIRHFQEAAPVDVVAICAELGVNVWEDHLGTGISGKMFRDATNGGRSGYSIVVNADDPFVRKRFTVAHELAHFLLHRNQASEIRDDVYYRSGLSSGLEVQANRLAADILMPFDLMNQLFERGTRDVESMAKALQVSLPAMKIRLGIPVA